MSTYAVESSVEAAEEFEDLKLEVNCPNQEVEKNEICLISVQERKKTSYKVIFWLVHERATLYLFFFLLYIVD